MKTELFLTFKPYVLAVIRHLSLEDIYRHFGKFLKNVFVCLAASGLIENMYIGGVRPILTLKA